MAIFWAKIVRIEGQRTGTNRNWSAFQWGSESSRGPVRLFPSREVFLISRVTGLEKQGPKKGNERWILKICVQKSLLLLFSGVLGLVFFVFLVFFEFFSGSFYDLPFFFFFFLRQIWLSSLQRFCGKQSNKLVRVGNNRTILQINKKAFPF